MLNDPEYPQLLFTTALTMLYLLVAVPMLVGMKVDFIMSPDAWIAANCKFIALTTRIRR